MVILALYFISIVGSILVVNTKKTDALHKIALGFVFLFLFIVLGWSYGAYDVMVGVSRYVNYQRFTSSTEFGYNLIILFGHKLNMSYRWFFVCCSFIELVIMFWFAEKNCDKPILVFLLFLFYPFVIYLQYIRNIAAFSIFLIGLNSLINKTKFYGAKYIFFVLLASLIHISVLFFLVPFILYLLPKKLSFVVLIIIFAFLFSGILIGPFYSFIQQVLGEDKATVVSGVSNAEGMFGRVVLELVSILYFFAIYIRFKLRGVDTEDHISKVYLNMNLCMFLIIPLTLFYGVGFSRFLVLMCLPNYAYFVKKIGLITEQKERRSYYIIIAVFACLCLFLNYRNEAYRDAVLLPFFNQNELF